MSGSPSDKNDEPAQSGRMLDEHGPRLAREAAELARENPDADPVGLIVAADAIQEMGLASLAEQAGRLPAGGFVGLVPRAMLRELLAQQAPKTLEWLVSSKTVGRRRCLPLVAATKEGFRVGAVDFVVNDEDPEFPGA